jgi:hypothetical protein
MREVISRAYGETYQDDLAFAESRFADVYYKSEEFSDEHKQNILYLLDILDREAERLRKKERTRKSKGKKSGS